MAPFKSWRDQVTNSSYCILDCMVICQKQKEGLAVTILLLCTQSIVSPGMPYISPHQSLSPLRENR